MAQFLDTVPVSCPLCRTERPVAFYQENGYRYWRCRGCRLLFLWPQPDSTFLEEHYQAYLPEAPELVHRWDEETAPVLDSAADRLQRLLPTGARVLDVGCGFGSFLVRMQAKGFAVEGVELSRKAAAQARERTKATIHGSPIERIRLERTFQAITMFYVIEHLRQPWKTLAALGSKLADGGVLLLRYPNTTPLLQLSRPLARRLRLMQAPSHLFDFSGTSMPYLLASAGFASMETRLDSNTRPSHPASRGLARASEALGSSLSRMTGHRFLLPGVSRTTLASKAADRFPIRLL